MKKTSILILLIILTIGNYFVWSQVKFYKQKGILLGMSWNKNKEADLLRYEVYTGPQSRNYDHVESTTDTIIYIFIPEAQKNDTLFAALKAVDTLEQKSPFSEEIACIPEVVSMDFKTDSLRRIDVNDIREANKKFKIVWGKTIYRKTKEAE